MRRLPGRRRRLRVIAPGEGRGDIALDSGDHPIVIADYGSSQGKNSLAPMRAAIAALRRRLLPRRPICVVHVDVAENDFSTLFDLLDTAPDS
jgi:hypothetical protein